MNSKLPLARAASVFCAASLVLTACQNPAANSRTKAPAPTVLSSTNSLPTSLATSTTKPAKPARRYTYTPRPYPVDERGYSPVDKALAKAYAREDMVTDDEEGALNPYILKVISGYPLDGSYTYHCGWDPREYDIYNGVTQDLCDRSMV